MTNPLFIILPFSLPLSEKETKNKCGIKVVAIERIKYKLVPVEVPQPNYLPNKQLTDKELKNAWNVFEYSGIKNSQGSMHNHHSGINQVNSEQANYYNPVNHMNSMSPKMPLPLQPPNLPMIRPPPVHFVQAMIPAMPQPPAPPKNHKNSKDQQPMQPSVEYDLKIQTRYDSPFELDHDSNRDSFYNDYKDNFYKENGIQNRKDSITRYPTMSKRRNSLKKRVSKKFYDYD